MGQQQSQGRAKGELPDDEEGQRRCRHLGGGDQLGDANRQDDRHRVVAGRLELEQRSQTPSQADAAGPKHREDRSGIGGGDDDSHQQADQDRKVEDDAGGDPGDGGRDNDADRRQRKSWPQHRAHQVPTGVEATGEKNEGERY